jgi:hypothetical protein
LLKLLWVASTHEEPALFPTLVQLEDGIKQQLLKKVEWTTRKNSKRQRPTSPSHPDVLISIENWRGWTRVRSLSQCAPSPSPPPNTRVITRAAVQFLLNSVPNERPRLSGHGMPCLFSAASSCFGCRTVRFSAAGFLLLICGFDVLPCNPPNSERPLFEVPPERRQ